MSYYLVETLKQLRREVDARYPGRSKSHDGWIGDTAHSKRKSDHNPDAKGRVKAVDITNPPGGGQALADRVRRVMIDRGQAGYVIHGGRICSSAKGWRWRHYTGRDPHLHHVHVSVHSQLDSTASWGIASPPLVPPVRSGRWDNATVRALQALTGADRDGDLGEETVKAWQEYLNRHGARLKVDGDFGSATARASESYLRIPVTKVAGAYPGLIRAIQSFLADKINTGVLK